MIISPTLENLSALTPASSYTVILPEPKISMEASKNISTSRTISGGAVTTIWNSDASGERRSVSFALPENTYQALKRIKDTGLDPWLLRVGGKIYEAAIDLTSAVKIQGLWRCQVEFVIIRPVL